MIGPRSRPLRFGVLASVLAFLASTNYCVLAALSGMPMACLELPSASAASQPGGHCAKSGGHCAGSDSESAPSLVSSCCVVVAATSPPDLDRPQLLAVVAAAAPAAADAPDDPDAIAFHPSDESPPPLRRLPAPLVGRAPPLG